MHDARVCLPFAEWPEADRTAWNVILSDGDLLDEDGRCSHWSTATRAVHQHNYGQWLCFLARHHPADLHMAPAQRISQERVGDFIELMSNRPNHLLDWRVVKQLSPVSQSARLISLYLVIRAFSPKLNWAWLNRAGQRLKQRANPDQLKPYLGVSASDLFHWGLTLIATAESEPNLTPTARAIAFRNGLIVAFLIACPVRRRAMGSMDTANRLHRTDTGYLLKFDADDMKDNKPRTFPLHRRLTLSMERYLEEHRPALLTGTTSTALWLTANGRRMTDHCLWTLITTITEEQFGTRLSVHDFRRVAATSVAEYDPAHAGIIRDVLGHSTMDMADRHYNQARSLEALRAHQDILERVIKRASKTFCSGARKSRNS